MATKRKTIPIASVYGKGQDRYLELIRRFPLRPLRSDADLDAAIHVIDTLIDQDERSAPEEDYLDVISDLVHAYEEEHIPVRPVPDSEMLEYLIGLREVTQAQLAAATGIAESTISEILTGKRKLTRAQIGKLARYFRVGPGVFTFTG